MRPVFFKKNPFIFILLPLLIGIVTSKYLPEKFLQFIPCILLIISVLCVFLLIINKFKYQWLFGNFCFIFLFLFGGYRMYDHFQPLELDSSIEKKYFAKVLETPIEKPKSYYTILKIYKIKDSLLIDINLRCVAYFQKTPKVKEIKVGEDILISGKLQNVLPNPNPYTFNYSNYLLNKHIQHQVYIRENKFSILKNEKTFYNKWFLVKNWQKYFVDKVNKYIDASEEKSILLAMLLGYRADLTPEIKEAFSHSGAMHVLAVSGLHVGILYLIIINLVGSLKHKRIGRWIYVILPLISIWIYAGITGFSPSVSRAAVMFSVFLIGSFFPSRKSVYNSITISAFILLIVEPHLIYYVGFQLSYLAVISIVFFQPYLSRLWIIQNKALNYIWQLITVSLAAQIGVFPLGIFYFNQFSNLFLLTNLIAINAAIVLLALGFLFLIFSWFSPIAILLGKLLNYGLIIFNQLIFHIDEIPFSVSQNLYITNFELLVIYLSIILISILILSKSKKLVFGIIILLIFFVGSNSLRKIRNQSQRFVVFHAIKNKTAIQYVNGNQAYLIVDSTVNEKDIDYNIRDLWLEKGVKSIFKYELKNKSRFVKPNIYISENFIFINDCKLAFLNNDKILTQNQLQIDYFIINNNSKPHFIDKIDTKKIILGNTLSYYKRKTWIEHLNKKGLSYHTVDKQNIFLKNLK